MKRFGSFLLVGLVPSLSALLVACSGDANLGKNNDTLEGSDDSGGASHVSAGNASAPRAGTANGSGGSDSAGGGTAVGGSTQAGGSSASGGATLVMGGAEMGGSAASGGAERTLGGAGGTDTLGAGGAELSADPEPIADLNTPGKGVCAGETLGSVLSAIWQGNPELADIKFVEDPESPSIGGSAIIFAFLSEGGFRLVFMRGSGDCPAGCIQREYWYFETDANCDPQRVGHYARPYDSAGNCYRTEGMPLWDMPTPPSSGTICPDTIPAGLNEACVDNQCPAGLTPVKFYGVAGTAGPEFCTCTIPCATDASVCPTGTRCQYIADGPGDVCYEMN